MSYWPVPWLQCVLSLGTLSVVILDILGAKVQPQYTARRGSCVRVYCCTTLDGNVSTVLRGTLVNGTYDGIHKNLSILPFLLTVLGPIKYAPPESCRLPSVVPIE